QPVTFENVATAAGETRYFWNIQSHTHSRGKDFDMYLRNSDGSKGAQIYEGFYNEDYTFNQGYYDFTHPAVKTFNPMLEVDMTNGLIFEATYLNNTGATIPFGLTTDGEMFVTYFSYTNALPTAVNDLKKDNSALQVFPNPAKNSFDINYTLTANGMVNVDLYNPAGIKVKTIFNGNQDEGKQTLHVDAINEKLSSGLYFLHLETNGSALVKKVVLMN
ncbi:MAG TPA: T9SS type A sorting domain-containing protein, partial [Chitinophagales bacterium]|nr:T9SS type A sorting domain-containing protein [Chitinophagales bacterium]